MRLSLCLQHGPDAVIDDLCHLLAKSVKDNTTKPKCKSMALVRTSSGFIEDAKPKHTKMLQSTSVLLQALRTAQSTMGLVEEHANNMSAQQTSSAEVANMLAYMSSSGVMPRMPPMTNLAMHTQQMTMMNNHNKQQAVPQTLSQMLSTSLPQPVASNSPLVPPTAADPPPASGVEGTRVDKDAMVDRIKSLRYLFMRW
jgi:hypothetical protein